MRQVENHGQIKLAERFKLKVGDRVTWRSQASGSWIQKIGAVVKVIGPMDDPREIAKREFPGHSRKYDSTRFLQGADYGVLVEVKPDRDSKAKPALYMPRIKALMLVGNRRDRGEQLGVTDL